MPEVASRTPARSIIDETADATHLEAKLWGGYGEQGAVALEALRTDPRTSTPEAVMAARALARYSAVHQKYGRALDLLSFIQTLDATYKRNTRILKIHCLLQQDRTDEARELIRNTLRKGHPADGCMHAALASACLIDADNGRLPRKEAVQRYLEYVSRPLRAGGHVGIVLRDPDRPLGLDNLAPETKPPAPVSMPVKVSVLMAVYNGADVIEYAIRSVLEQSWRNLELVIVDDASTDESWALIQRLAEEDDRIIPVRHERNAGPYAARNTALKKASGDYIVVNDADDWAHPQKIEAQVSHLLRHTNVISNMTFRVRVAADMTAIPRLDSGHTPIIHNDYSALMLSRQKALSMGGWDRVRFSADAEFVERLMKIEGSQAVQKIRGGMPLSFSLWDTNNLTTSSSTNIQTNRYGARHEYVRQFREWHRSGENLKISRTSQQHPFPVPGICYLPRGTIQKLDVVLVTGVGLQDDAVLDQCLNELNRRKLSAGILLWPRFDSTENPDDSLRIAALSRKHGIIPVVHGDNVRCRLLLVHPPESVREVPAPLPNLSPWKISLLGDDNGTDNARTAGMVIEQVFGKTLTHTTVGDIRRLLNRTFLKERIRMAVRWRLRRIKAAFEH